MKRMLRGHRLFDLRGATALVAGGTAGLGFCMAEALLDSGARVCVASRDPRKRARHLARLARRHGGRCLVLTADLRVESSVTGLVKAVGRRFGGRLNVAVNAAGINIRHPLTQVALGEWEAIQRTNTTGAFLFARAVFPLLRRARWGRLINVASIFAARSFKNRAAYAASKGALLQLSRTLALEWAPYRITVNCISPGPFLTEMNRPVLKDRKNYREFCSRIPLGRFGDPPEIATACLFLASPASSYVSGIDLRVDGGWTVQ